MKELKYPLLILTLVLILLVLLFLKVNNDTAEDFSLNLITEILGIFITVLLIDLVIKRKDDREKKKILKNTFAQFKIPAQNLLSFFASIYKASTDTKPKEWNTDYKSLLSTEQFYDSIKHLDFLKTAPVTPSTNWINHSHHQMTGIKNGFEKIIDKYAFALDSQIISDLEWLTNNWIINILSSGPIILASDQSMNHKREYFCLLAIQNETGIEDNPIKELIDKVFEVAEYFKSITDETSDIHYSDSLWQENMSPKLSESRVSVT
ncbi:hypothetical protein [Algoriphagus chordae]|uniref:Uncharacterized protein n=1 Tax=Algoriphagus chordae TaxID=237019 RepID=A0A2W7QEI3_9BACT|nr:hypothetical protein [Algoriphagus chordae]PZX46938.1 hypothetical protein LV85_04162 [Algoriphagus chordae]